MRTKLRHMAGRRAEIRRRFNVTQQFEELEESCLPSYCHPNPLAAYAAWWRLFAAAKLAPQTGPLLDFGAASGEFAYLQTGDYDYVEGNEVLAKALAADLPSAQRQTLNALPSAHYSTIVALDSLEHNDDSRQIIDLLVNSLRQDGSFILSGPTENFLYRIGRRLAGFNGHYHVKTVYDLQSELAAAGLVKKKAVLGPFLTPLFVVSLWQRV